jgi:hypothetical protein
MIKSPIYSTPQLNIVTNNDIGQRNYVKTVRTQRRYLKRIASNPPTTWAISDSVSSFTAGAVSSSVKEARFLETVLIIKSPTSSMPQFKVAT